MRDFGREVALAALEIKAIKLNTENPFQWASGYRMPIYNDNRMFLFYPEYRKLIRNALKDITDQLSFSVIAGTSTAGISPATSLADHYGSPLIYVRDKPKDHGLRNQIEGIDAEEDLKGHYVLLIEDLISTGGSSAAAVQAIRDAKGVCDYCVSIFNYGLNVADDIFEGRSDFNNNGGRLQGRCNVDSILSYDILLAIAKEEGYLKDRDVIALEEWRANPFGWGEKKGFPRVVKKQFV